MRDSIKLRLITIIHSLQQNSYTPNDKPPSPEICSARWEMIKRLEFEDVRRLEFEENEIDNLGQKDAEAILKELK